MVGRLHFPAVLILLVSSGLADPSNVREEIQDSEIRNIKLILQEYGEKIGMSRCHRDDSNNAYYSKEHKLYIFNVVNVTLIDICMITCCFVQLIFLHAASFLFDYTHTYIDIAHCELCIGLIVLWNRAFGLSKYITLVIVFSRVFFCSNIILHAVFLLDSYHGVLHWSNILLAALHYRILLLDLIQFHLLMLVNFLSLRSDRPHGFRKVNAKLPSWSDNILVYSQWI